MNLAAHAPLGDVQPIASTTPEYWSSPPQILSHLVVAAGCVVLVQKLTLTLPPIFVGSDVLAAVAPPYGPACQGH